MNGPHKVIGFSATATDPKGEEYDASFMVWFPLGRVTQHEVNNAVNGAVQQFLEYHPNGAITSQMERTIMMRA